ncbi:MAG: ketosteroid isomerase, partial [Deltaproteobacteria bacterium]|nr:ketosteroid isomerase [Deltaproteobacteria bacterium]
ELNFDGVSVFEISPEGLIQNVRSYWDKTALMASL